MGIFFDFLLYVRSIATQSKQLRVFYSGNGLKDLKCLFFVPWGVYAFDYTKISVIWSLVNILVPKTMFKCSRKYLEKSSHIKRKELLYVHKIYCFQYFSWLPKKLISFGCVVWNWFENRANITFLAFPSFLLWIFTKTRKHTKLA